MEEFEGHFLKGLITLSIIISRFIKLFLAKKIVSIVPTGKSTLFPGLASLQSLLELLSSQVIPPCICVFALQICDIYRSLF
jgi:hypothetical protein